MIRSFLVATMLATPLSLFAQPYINPCAQANPVHVVVLGSSTAAGAGPSSPDSTWVNKYRKYLQNINPGSQVTNLAIGGTTTYHIMPDWFIPPPGRPNSNPNNNVTQAITLGADAIIVNMPSNDTGNGFGTNEQMNNFITISQTADSAGIPAWICTTQPRNYGQQWQLDTQTEVRDSVLSYFGSYSIDFWTGIGDSTDHIMPQFDSGDGVHLNDAGHAILVSRVKGKEIPNVLADTLQTTDHLVQHIFTGALSVCGDSSTLVSSVIINRGVDAVNGLEVVYEVSDNLLGGTTTDTIFISNPMDACTVDTVTTILNTYDVSDFDIRSYLTSTDIDKSNDTSQVLNIRSTGHPFIYSLNDTICYGDSVILNAHSNLLTDTIVWYDAGAGGNIISYGNDLLLGNVTSNQTYYAEAVRGPLHFRNSLFTTSTTTTNFNGIMFDLVAKDTIVIDSIMTRINSTGMQVLQSYYKPGSHQGSETDPNAWTIWGTDSADVDTAGEFHYFNFPDLVINDGDTVGVYLHMANAGSNLSYQALSNPLTKSTQELNFISGSGISHTFGNVYTPRSFSGEVFYHFGFNPSGDCTSPRVSVTAVVSEPMTDLGADTTLLLGQSITLTPTGSFISYLWSTGSTTPSITIDTTILSPGTNQVWVEVTDAFGCTATDTIQVTFTVGSGLSSPFAGDVTIHPNPSNGLFRIVGLPQTQELSIRILDINGRETQILDFEGGNIDIHDLSSGYYILEIRSGNQFRRLPVVKF